MPAFSLIVAIFVCTTLAVNSFSLKTNKISTKGLHHHNRQISLNMLSLPDSSSLLDPSGGLARALGVVPVCLEPYMMPTTKTTVIDDPTAGMTPDEITNYLSNVGGGLCGYPDSVRTLIGLSLNLSLLALGVLALSYAVVGTISFVLDKRVEDLLKKESAKYPELSGSLPGASTLQRSQFQSMSDNDEDDTLSASGLRIPAPKDGLNRQERRFRKNFLESDKKDTE